MKLKDKVAFVPGGTTPGIGREIARAYVQEGAKVVVASSNPKNVDAMTQEFKDNGNDALSLLMDVRDRSNVDATVEKIIEKYGKIDILCYSSALTLATPFFDISEDELDRVVDINLNGAYRCTQAVVREMVTAGTGGSVIFIGSSQGLVGVPLMAHYTATKGGLIAFTKALASEISPLGIRVNLIAAGLTITDTATSLLPPEYFQALEAKLPVRRMGKPEDYTGAAVLLASDEGSFITGETFAVDGGVSNVVPPLDPTPVAYSWKKGE